MIGIAHPDILQSCIDEDSFQGVQNVFLWWFFLLIIFSSLVNFSSSDKCISLCPEYSMFMNRSSCAAESLHCIYVYKIYNITYNMIYIKCIYTFDEKENYDRTDSLRMLVILVMMAMMAIMAMMSMMAMKTKTMMVMMLKTMMVMMLMVSQIALVSPLEWCHCQCCAPVWALYCYIATLLHLYIATLLHCSVLFTVLHCTVLYTKVHCTLS